MRTSTRVDLVLGLTAVLLALGGAGWGLLTDVPRLTDGPTFLGMELAFAVVYGGA